MSDETWTPRGGEYLRGYASAMKYAAAFVRDAGLQGTPLAGALEVLAGHLEEKVGMETRGAMLDAELERAIASSQAPDAAFSSGGSLAPSAGTGGDEDRQPIQGGAEAFAALGGGSAIRSSHE